MKYRYLGVSTMALLILGCSPQQPTPNNSTKTNKMHQTEVFSILHPANFSSLSSGDGGTYFTSPDGDVKFYVSTVSGYSTSSLYNKLRAKEILLSDKSEKGGNDKDYYDYVFSGWKTIKDKNGAYYRSSITRRRCNTKGKEFYGNCVYSIIGIRYTDTNAYKKYADTFMAFKNSLDIKKKN